MTGTGRIRMWGRAIGAALLTLTIKGHVAAQDFTYVRVDPQPAATDPTQNYMNWDLASWSAKPFWTLVKPYVNRSGPCARLPGPTYPSQTASAPVTVTDASKKDLIEGFTQARSWMQAWGMELSPGSAAIRVVPADQTRAGNIIPVFCYTETSGRRETMHLDAIDHSWMLGSVSLHLTESKTTRSEFAQYQTYLEAAAGWADILIENYQMGPSDTGVGLIPEADGSDVQWIRQGIIDAISVSSVEENFGVKFFDFSKPEERMSYLPSDFNTSFTDYGGRAGAETTTGAFWYWLATEVFDGDYAEFAPLLRQIGGLPEYHMTYADTFINERDGSDLYGWRHAFPTFVAVYANWWDSRLSEDMTEDVWINQIFGTCHKLEVSETEPTHSQTFTLQPHSAKCIDVSARADRSDWTADLKIELRASDERLDNVFMAMSKSVPPSNMAAEPVTCDTLIFGDYSHRCIHVPTAQLKDPETGEWLRHYSGEDKERGVGTDPGYSRNILTYTPGLGSPHSEEPVELTITLSLDVATTSSDLFEVKTFKTEFASKTGFSPVSGKADRQATGFGEDALNGAVAIDPSLFETAMGFADNRLAVMDDQGVGLEFKLIDVGVLDSKATGEFDLMPIYGEDGMVALPDPDKPSKIEIIEHTRDTFTFSAEAHICMLPIAELLQRGNKRELDLCEIGERHTIEADGAVPFPDFYRTKTKPETVETENYRELRAMRIQTFNNMASTMGIPTVEPSRQSRPSPQPGPQNNHSSSSGGEIPAGLTFTCSMLTGPSTCDCSCEAKVCMARKKADGTLTPSENSCRLTCGKKWKACSP